MSDWLDLGTKSPWLTFDFVHSGVRRVYRQQDQNWEATGRHTEPCCYGSGIWAHDGWVRRFCDSKSWRTTRLDSYLHTHMNLSMCALVRKPFLHPRKDMSFRIQPLAHCTKRSMTRFVVACTIIQLLWVIFCLLMKPKLRRVRFLQQILPSSLISLVSTYIWSDFSSTDTRSQEIIWKQLYLCRLAARKHGISIRATVWYDIPGCCAWREDQSCFANRAAKACRFISRVRYLCVYACAPKSSCIHTAVCLPCVHRIYWQWDPLTGKLRKQRDWRQSWISGPLRSAILWMTNQRVLFTRSRFLRELERMGLYFRGRALF